MADIVIDRSEGAEVHVGQVGFREFYGVGTFNSTDATGTLPVGNNITRITQLHLTPLGTPAADENLSGPTPTLGIISLTSGRITITRTGASKTAALKFSFLIRGR